MRTAFRAAALTAALAACGPSMRVRTALNPEASLGELRTFRVLPVPRARIARPWSPNDPMLVNSITNRALRDDLIRAFQDRGYVLTDSNPDFAVAYYASARDTLDVTYWDYGYPWRPRWGRPWGPATVTVTRYTQGTVIVDVIDPGSRELLWRGQATARVSDDQQEYLEDLQRAVTAILQEFPAAPAPEKPVT